MMSSIKKVDLVFSSNFSIVARPLLVVICDALASQITTNNQQLATGVNTTAVVLATLNHFDTSQRLSIDRKWTSVPPIKLSFCVFKSQNEAKEAR